MKTRPLAILSVLAIASAPYAPVFAEETLGRLFFTPEKRQTLDHQRQFNIQEKLEIPEEPTFTIDGVVTRSSGKQTIWVNGSVQEEQEVKQGVTVTPNRINPGKVIVQSEDGPTSTASVGDTVNRTTGETTGLLSGGQIRIPSFERQ